MNPGNRITLPYFSLLYNNYPFSENANDSAVKILDECYPNQCSVRIAYSFIQSGFRFEGLEKYKNEKGYLLTARDFAQYLLDYYKAPLTGSKLSICKMISVLSIKEFTEMHSVLANENNCGIVFFECSKLDKEITGHINYWKGSSSLHRLNPQSIFGDYLKNTEDFHETNVWFWPLK